MAGSTGKLWKEIHTLEKDLKSLPTGGIWDEIAQDLKTKIAQRKKIAQAK